MKKSKLKPILVVGIVMLVALGCMFLVACEEEIDYDAKYVIQYTDDTGTYTIDVKYGQPYSISRIPSQEGYDFMGLYDSEDGGTQYINAKGASLVPFNDAKNIILFPQFKAKEYTLVLKFQGADPGNYKEGIQISYGESIRNLPTADEVVLEEKEFVGWFTEPDCQGLQVADEYGINPENSIVTTSRFTVSSDGFIFLYAGFKGATYSVTFHAGPNVDPEVVEVEHGTPISSVMPECRNEEGLAVLTWSQKGPNESDRIAYRGKVQSDLTLYALECAPAIDFDANGGEEISYIVRSAGSTIKLPVTTRENWKFAGWYNVEDGSEYSGTILMPSESITLKAEWTPMIIFDTRGGTAVSNIVTEAFEEIVLPETSKDGYIFAGWYTEAGKAFTSSIMPKDSTKLVAKYHKMTTKIYTLLSENEIVGDEETPGSAKMTRENKDYFCIDLSDLYNAGVESIKITANYKTQVQSSSYCDTYMSWYSERKVNSDYKVWSYTDSYSYSNSWKTCKAETTLELNKPMLYVCLYTEKYYSSSTNGQWKDFYVEIEYEDMSKLY